MQVSKDVVYRCVAGEHILIPVGAAAQNKSGMYTLSEVGGEIWKLLSDGKTPDEITVELANQYDAPQDMIRADALELIEKLKEAGLVTE